MAESWNWAGDDKYKKRQRSFVRGVLLTAGLLLFVADSSPPCRSDDDSTSSVPRETWLKMAADELRNAAPDDAGFAEGWMPIADAWQLVGNDAEARDAIRSAREALPRMTLVERVIESTIDLCQHESFDPAFSERLIRDAAEMCEQVSDKWDRGTFYAHLSGLAATFGHRALADSLLKQSLGLINMKAGGFKPEKLVCTQQSRAAAWTEPPATILAICRKLERLRFPDPLVNANVYAHLAMSAARHHDRTQFLRGMFRAETALAPVRIENHPNYLCAVRLAEANLLQRRWRAAVIISNNTPDPAIRASILFRVMKDAPQEVRSPHLAQLFEQFADQRWACSAVASHVEHRIRTGEDQSAVVAWAQKLPLASQRASAYAGVARASGSVSTESVSPVPGEAIFDRPEIGHADSLVEAAERLAAGIEDHPQSAFAWIQIARTWHLLGRTLKYRHAVARVDDRLFDEWISVWSDRPLEMDSWSESDDRRKKETRSVQLINTCLRELSKMQADMGDARGAMETCLDLANATGFLISWGTCGDFGFLHLRTIADRLQSETGVGSDVFPPEEHRDFVYTEALLAAATKDIPGLQTRIPKLKQRVEQGGGRLERVQLARAQCELALLYAERGNIDDYRAARRAAQSQITQGNAPSEMKCMLATADAFAGEFALAEANLVPGTVAWFGDANRPRSRLAIALANDGQWQKAISHAQEIPLLYPVWRGDSWEAIAKARFKDQSEARYGLLDWVETLEAPTDRVGALCGLALAASRQ